MVDVPWNQLENLESERTHTAPRSEARGSK
ncbi:hypothetical protein SCOR_23775 [Sulfidibacter corallicola]